MEAMKHSESVCVCVCVCVYAYILYVCKPQETHSETLLSEWKKKKSLVTSPYLLSSSPLPFYAHSLHSLLPLPSRSLYLSSQLTLLLSVDPYHSPNLSRNPSHPAIPHLCPTSSISPISSFRAGSLLPFLLMSPVSCPNLSLPLRPCHPTHLSTQSL